MLKVNKNITINGSSEIEGVQAVYMSATVSTDGSSSGNINTSITNKELYNANKVAVRKDINDFTVIVYEVEDQINLEVVK